MKLPRRTVLQFAAGVAALSAVPRVAQAQAYPSRPVRILVGASPGGTLDLIARLVGQWLADRLGQPFVVENRAGAGNNLATDAVVRAAPDGYTLLLTAVSNAINASLYDKLSHNFMRDIAPVASVVRVPLVMEVNLSVPAKTVPEFIAYAKANPGKISMASAGNGTSPHVGGELFKMMTGVDMLHVPYRAGSPPALTDMIGGRIQVMFDLLPSSIGHLRAGTLRALAVTTSTRVAALPDVPTVGDYVPGYEASTWQGIGAPKNTPTEIVDKLNKEINAALADAKFRARLADIGAAPFPGSPADFGKFIAEETEKWAKVVKFSGAKPE